MASTTFDDFTYLRATPHDPGCPGWNTTAAVTLDTGAGKLTVTGNTYGGAAVSQWAGDDDYVAQADIDLNSGALAHLVVRYMDPDNWMAAEIRSNGSVKLVKCLDGRETNVASNTYTPAGTVNVRIKASGTTYTIWVAGTQKISTTDGDLPWGTVALSGRSPKFSAVKFGYDNNADGDIADAGDDLVLSEPFAATAYTLNADHSDGNNDAWCRAGNLVDDGQMRYTYDAWNRLVKVTRKQDTDIVIQTAEYDGLGRRVQKVVTKSGDLDGTFVYYYADTRAAGFSPREFSGGGGLAGIGSASPGGWSIVEIRDGSNNIYQQVYHGTQYIDEIVAMRLKKGYAVVYQDANWNTVVVCDLAGRVLERMFTTPYGSPTIEPESFFGDYDGDGDVDSTDDASLGSGQTCWGTPSGACRIFDFNQDGTLDASDETIMTALVSAPSTNRRHESRKASPIGMGFLHQGLAFSFEVGRYQNRDREYLEQMTRFDRRDSLGFVDGIHYYSYLSGNPISRVDPLGLYYWVRGCPPCTWRHAGDCAMFCRTPGNYGMTYCFRFHGWRCVCICDNNINSEYPAAAPIITKCVEEHELVHHDERCEAGECSAYSKEGVCILLSVKQCDSLSCELDVVRYVSDGLDNCDAECTQGANKRICKSGWCGSLKWLMDNTLGEPARLAAELYRLHCMSTEFRAP